MIRPLDLRLLTGATASWGICLLALKTTFAPAALIILGLVALTALWWPRRAARHRTAWRGWLSQTIALGCLLAVAVGALAITHVQIRHERIENLLEFTDADTRLALTLTSEVKDGTLGPGAHARLVQAVTRDERLATTIPVYLIGASQGWQVGQHVIVSGGLSRSKSNTIFLRVRTIHEEHDLSGISALVGHLRNGVRDASGTLAPYSRGLIPGVSIGDTRRLPEHLDDAMKATSLAHITAVSGAHVAVVLATVMALFAPARPMIKGPIALAVLAMMVLVVLPTASVLRASAMGLLTLLGLMTARPRLALPGLFGVVLGLLAVDPWLAGSIGFALSAGVTAGILTLSEPIAARLGGGLAARLVAVPLAAQLACAPLLLTFDASIAVYSVPANILAMPALAPATILGLASAAASLAHAGAAALLASGAAYFAAWIGAVAVFFANLPGARVPWLAGAAGAPSLILLTILGYVAVMRGTLRRPRKA